MYVWWFFFWISSSATFKSHLVCLCVSVNVFCESICKLKMHVLLHVSLEENRDLIKCISTIYEHWKIVYCCPTTRRRRRRSAGVLTFRPASPKKAPAAKQAGTSRTYPRECSKSPPSASTNTCSIATYHIARRVWNNHQSWVSECTCICVFDHNETVTQIWTENENHIKVWCRYTRVLLRFLSFYLRNYLLCSTCCLNWINAFVFFFCVCLWWTTTHFTWFFTLFFPICIQLA